MRAFCIISVSLMLLGYTTSAQIIHIPEDYPSIQSGIDHAGNGDTVLVNEGRYYENINFKGKAITLASLFFLDGDTSHISQTIIDGSRPAHPDTASTILIVSGEDTTSVLFGLTVTGGRGTLLRVTANRFLRAGGGILMLENGGKILSNIIEENNMNFDNVYATLGGGMYILFNDKTKAISIQNNLIRNNFIESVNEIGGAGIGIGGGGNLSMIIENNKICNNTAMVTGTARRAHGGGLYMRLDLPDSSDISLRNNEISYNSLLGRRTAGAGIDIVYTEPDERFIDLLHCPVISGNIISHNTSQILGGGFRIQTNRNIRNKHTLVSPRPIIINNIITNNSASDGSGLLILRSCPLLINNTIRNDLTGQEGSEVLVDEESSVYTHNNEFQDKWKGKRVLGLFGRYYLKIENTYLKIILTDEDDAPQVHVLPPLWRIWWAFIAYGLVIVVIFLWYRTFLLNRTKIRTALEIERIEKEKVQEINRMKSRFFANISHEFRTPLTLLMGPINDLAKNRPDLAEGDKNLLRMMHRNVGRLMSLINQLLDLSKLEIGKVTLQVAEADLTAFVRRIVISFLSLAESKKIQYEYNLTELPGRVYFDGDKLEKILTNLISNAFKFTPEDGIIKVILKYSDTGTNNLPRNMELSVIDSGKGIPEEMIDKVFDRFYQVGSPGNAEDGKGIGLSLTKELVELYRGRISVESAPGKGSIFTVVLPVAKEKFNENEIANEVLAEPAVSGNEVSLELLKEQAEYEIQENQDTGREGPLILIVEDNLDLRKYISKNLDPSFQILEAENGREGMDKTIETIPDLVISDLMMPVMDGMEMCKHLKSDNRTSHIPIILLTAKADRDSKMEGFETGADDYIIKPFDSEELQVRVRNLIGQRRRLRESYRKEFLTDVVDLKLAAPEEEFLSRVMKCIELHLSDLEFSVEKLGEDLHLSRTQLYRKILALTDYSPVELIRNTRLRMAARMFRSGHKNVSKVMYEVGISSPSHFTRSFRELFGVNPSEYIKNS
ncbi:ATP-binding protein [Bacteroidota bacterium]